LLAAIDPGPFENWREYGSKPASRSKTTEKLPPIGSVPFMPMNELLNPLAARVQSDPWFCFWIRYEEVTADYGSKGAPWLCQPKPMSTMPKSVMPCQVSWQLVAMKSAGSVHGPGSAVDVIVAGGAFVDVTSAARTSAAHVKSKTARSNAAQTLGLAIGKLPAVETELTDQLGSATGTPQPRSRCAGRKSLQVAPAPHSSISKSSAKARQPYNCYHARLLLHRLFASLAYQCRRVAIARSATFRITRALFAERQRC
jgi:hypothetical protein